VFGGRFVYKVECTVGATVGGVGASLGARGPDPGLAGAPVSGEPCGCARVWATRAPLRLPSRCSWQLAGNSGALCCPVHSLFSCKLYILTPYIERPPYRVYRVWSLDFGVEACHHDARAAITLEVRLGVREIFSNTKLFV